MSDLSNYTDKRRKKDPEFNDGFEIGYESFKIGVILKKAREDAGMTQDEIADAIGTKKTAISRLENHAEDVRLSTLEKYVHALGKRITVKIA